MSTSILLERRENGGLVGFEVVVVAGAALLVEVLAGGALEVVGAPLELREVGVRALELRASVTPAVPRRHNTLHVSAQAPHLTTI